MSALRFGIAALCFAPNAVRGFKDPKMRIAAVELGLYLFGEAALLPAYQAQVYYLVVAASEPLHAGGYICQAWGLEYTTAGRAAFTFTFTGDARC